MGKDLERYYQSRLSGCVADLPMGELLEPDLQDFLPCSENRTIGVEATSSCSSPNLDRHTQQEIQSLRNRIIERAEELHCAAGGPALYLAANFDEQYILRKQDIPRLAESLSSAVLLADVPISVQELSLTLNPCNLPSEIPDIRILGSVGGIDRLWYAGC